MNNTNTPNNKIQTSHGPVRYTLTNDYMFRAVLQKSMLALKSLLACLLGIPLQIILSVEILNPIILGESVDTKDCIMDLRINLNNKQIINLEMPVVNNYDWPERSLYYLSRAFANIPRGGTYADVKPCIHIGILDFTLFKDNVEFYSEYCMRNSKTNKIYSDKFLIRVLDLTQIDTQDAKKNYPDLYYWAKLFKAQTWEELNRLSNQSDGMNDAVLTLKQLSKDEKIQLQCEAREMYEFTLASSKRAGIIEGHESGLKEGHESGLKEGHESGLKEGHESGLKEGLAEVSRNNALVAKLLDSNRIDDLQKAIADPYFKDTLYKEFNL